LKIDVKMEIDIPESIVNQIMSETQKQMADEVCEYIEEQRALFKRAGTNQAIFASFGMNMVEKKLEEYR